MQILAIETATSVASVALARDGEICSERSLSCRANVGARLAPMIANVLGDGGASMSDLDAIAVSAGPGSFTGLRVGVATAAGLGFSCRLPVISVPTLEALAASSKFAGECLLTLLDAQRGEVYVAIYVLAADGWSCKRGPEVVAVVDLAPWLGSVEAIVGNGLDRYYDQIAAAAFGTRLLAGVAPTAAAVARLAARREGAPAGLLEPLYLRAPAAAAYST